MHFVRGDVRDHIVSHKNDHGPSAEPSKNRPSRYFRSRSIFDFCNTICQLQKLLLGMNRCTASSRARLCSSNEV
jgi:hypothetical protein